MTLLSLCFNTVSLRISAVVFTLLVWDMRAMRVNEKTNTLQLKLTHSR